jgi:hypothetical protein
VLWERATGKQRLTLAGAASEVALSPDGRWLVTGGDDQVVRVWDLATEKVYKELAGHEGAVERLAFSADGKVLVSGGAEGTALVWDFAALTADAKGKPAKLAEGELDGLWNDLGDEDAEKAYRAVRKLAVAPEQAAALVKGRLKRAAPAVGGDRVAKLVADLDSDDFATREKATKDLMALGKEAEEALVKLLEKPPSVEAKTRAQRILDGIRGGGSSPAALRLGRAVEVLELAAAPETRKLLEEYAGSDQEVALAREAKAALERLARLGK